MNKRHLHHAWTQLRKIKPWYFLVFALLTGLVCILALRANNQQMAELRTAVFAADKNNGDVNKAIKELQQYVTSHMNTDLSAGNSGVYPPIQLKYTYERLVQAQQQAGQTGNALYTEAQRVCEQQNPTGVSGGSRVPYIVNGAVTYSVQWYISYTPGVGASLAGKGVAIRGVQPGGQSKRDYQALPEGTTYVQAVLSEPQEIYFAVYGGASTVYYEFQGGSVKTASLTPNDFVKPYPTFLLSPNSNQTFWTELRDGKNTLFTGDNNAANKKQIATLSDYSPYGWYSDSYTLVSKNSSELYIMPAGGLDAGKTPLKITDYYKPAQTYAGYGYGYGGL